MVRLAAILLAVRRLAIRLAIALRRASLVRLLWLLRVVAALRRTWDGKCSALGVRGRQALIITLRGIILLLLAAAVVVTVRHDMEGLR